MTTQRHQLRIYGPGDLRSDKVSIPLPGEHDVLVRIHACGICGTDLSYLAAGGLTSHPAGAPLAIGHEVSGVIDAVGSAVSDLKPGMRVVVNPDDNMIGNGSPEGGFTELLLVSNARKGENILLIPDHINLETAALIEPLSVSLHGVNRAHVKPESKVVVLGAGMIGLGAVIGLRRRGVSDIVVVDNQIKRLEIALKLGATNVIDPTREDLTTRLGKLHGCKSKYGFPMTASDVYIDAAGAPTLLQQVIGSCRTGARIVIIAVYKQPMPVDLLMVMVREIEIAGSIVYPDNEFSEVIDMLDQIKEDTDLLITHRFGFDQFAQAFQQAADASRAVKVMVRIAP